MPRAEYRAYEEDTELAWAWAAGLFEGEGSIVSYMVTNRKPPWSSSYRRRLLTLKMTDEDVVRRFHQIVGAGRVSALKRSTKYPHWKPQWAWECTRWDEIENILRRFLPYLGNRRRDAAEYSVAHPAHLPQTHCKRGHEFTMTNTYVHPKSGSRSCRLCRHMAYLKAREARVPWAASRSA